MCSFLPSKRSLTNASVFDLHRLTAQYARDVYLCLGDFWDWRSIYRGFPKKLRLQSVLQSHLARSSLLRARAENVCGFHESSGYHEVWMNGTVQQSHWLFGGFPCSSIYCSILLFGGFIYVPMYRSVHPSIYLSIHLSAYICLSIDVCMRCNVMQSNVFQCNAVQMLS